MNGIGKAGLLVLWVLCAAGCNKPVEPAAVPETVPPASPVAVSGESALEEVRRLVELGPRDAGTAGAEKAAAWLLERLRELGVEAEIQEFREPSPKGETVFRNVLGRIPGNGDQIVMFGSHYDTKTGIESFEGANDSGSSTGVLLELARGFLRDAPHPMEIRFAFFDGEECLETYGPADGFHGSKHLAQTMEEDGSMDRIAALILLDMVGDRDLTFTVPRNTTPWLAARAFDVARRLGVRNKFQLFPYMIGDDHDAFLKHGVPAIDLIDFHFGSAPGQNDYWHTPADTMDKLSAESLGIAGLVAAGLAEDIMWNGPEK